MKPKNQHWATVDTYISNLFNPQDDILDAAMRDSMPSGTSMHNISPNQGKLLHMLTLLCKAKNILEIGTFAGYSTIWLARALPDDGHMITLEYNPAHAALAREHLARAGLGTRVTVHEGDARDTLAQLRNGQTDPFDMVFIDIDNKQLYLPLLEQIVPLTHPGTLIVADNAIRDGRVANPNETDGSVTGVQAFNAALAAHPRLMATIVQMVGIKGWDGIALAIVQE